MTENQKNIQAISNQQINKQDVREHMDDHSERLTAEARKIKSNGVTYFELITAARETIEALDGPPLKLSALLTGNIEPMAYLKMELVGLEKFFTLPGAFGDESHNRRDLPALAAERIRKHLQLDLAPEHFIVIGDTPNDIDCARHFGARAVAVGTGRFYSNDEILQHSPDRFLRDLTDVDAVIKTLDEL
jgi:phosphoglycolate phosphatase-like HAD superfamily hydrolase